MLVDNLDLFWSAAPKDAHSEGCRLGEQSQGLPLDGEPRLPKWKEDRSGATSGEAGGALRKRQVALARLNRAHKVIRAAMITVYKVPISKEQFRVIPRDERALVFVAGHVLNQISVFLKLIRFSTSKDPSDPIEARVSAAQSQIMVRCLIGVLVEAWEFIRKPINRKIIGRYLDSIGAEGRMEYDKLNKHFGKSGFLYKLRNSFLYHYPNSDDLEKAFEWIPEDEEWEWYLSEANTNSFYFSCELTLGYGIMNATGEPLHIFAFGAVMQQVTKVADALPYFLMPLMRAILFTRLGPKILDPQPGTVVKDAPKIDEFWIPFFAETFPR